VWYRGVDADSIPGPSTASESVVEAVGQEDFTVVTLPDGSRMGIKVEECGPGQSPRVLVVDAVTGQALTEPETEVLTVLRPRVEKAPVVQQPTSHKGL
jgi:hypothetical protein